MFATFITFSVLRTVEGSREPVPIGWDPGCDSQKHSDTKCSAQANQQRYQCGNDPAM
jgi:hypothetical protein